MKTIYDLSNQIKQVSKDITTNGFFTEAQKQGLPIEFWRTFVIQKYGAISYFIDLLKSSAHLSLCHSSQLRLVFLDNLKDETGYFAGKIRPEYAHEVWRLKSLATFGVSKEDLIIPPLISTVQKHGNIMVEFSKNQDFLFLSGGLLFLEYFVSQEMKSLIKLFERDLPTLFPKGDYLYENFPHNIQEYWYSHAFHDVYHFKCIEEALISYVEERPHETNAITRIESGFKEVEKAKRLLYGSETFFELQK